MKKVTTILAAILLMAVGATAQKLSYSAVVRNSANELVANENIMVAVSIANSNGGAEVYGETHSATTNANGLVTLTIGEGTGATGSLADVTWKTAFITTTYTLSSGTVTNTVPVNAVPYALYADNISADGLVSAIASLTDEQKAAVLAALGVSGGGGGSETFSCGVDKMIIGEGVDRQEYETVQIGTQCWTKTNLRTTKKADGGDIADGGSNTSETEPYYYDNSSSSIPLAERGYLYNWAAAMVACPTGWHLPSDAEWNTMEATVSGSEWQTSYETANGNYRGSHAGKLAGGDKWETSSTSGTPGDYGNADRNVSGFSAVPAGSCNGSSFYNAGNVAYFWNATQSASNTSRAYDRVLYYDNVGVFRNDGNTKNYGLSVRCLKDASGDEPGGGGGGGSETFTCGVDKMIIGEGADRQEYETVQIGTQCWTKTNLRTTKKADGGDIADGGSNYSYTEPYYYDYSSSSIPLAERGYLYNWAAANVVCPVGWHLPSDAEWMALEQPLTTMDVSGTGWRGDHAGKLAGGSSWQSSSEANAPGNMSYSERNASGFGAVPAGDWLNGFYDAGNNAYFWSSTELGSVHAWGRYLNYNYADVKRLNDTKSFGFSVRCLRD